MGTGLVRWILIAVGAFFLLLPVLFAPHPPFSDNLDSEVPLQVALRRQGIDFGISPELRIESVMNGAPRAFHRIGNGVVGLCFRLFAPATAYVCVDLLTRLLAGLGLWLWITYLLRAVGEERVPVPERDLIAVGCAVAFSLISISTPLYGLSVVGFPLIFYAAILIREGGVRARVAYLVFGLYPFFSSAIMSGFVIVMVGGPLLLWQSWRRRTEVVRRGSIALGLFVLSTLLSEVMLIRGVLRGGVWHRAEFALSSFTFGEAFERAMGNFFAPSWTDSVCQVGFMRWVVLAALMISLRAGGPLRRTLAVVVGAMAVVVLFDSFSFFAPVSAFRESFGVIKSFQFNRVYYLYPALCYTAFALGLGVVAAWLTPLSRGGRQFVLALCLFGQLGYLGYTDANLKAFVHRLRGQTRDVWNPTFDEIYSPALLQEVDDEIGLPNKADYRVISVGLNPALAIYHGFFTLDGYHGNYSLKYKHAFRRLIVAELNASEALKTWFDDWGSRCYLFSHELGGRSDVRKTETYRLTDLRFDATAARELSGGRPLFLFSALEVENAAENQLHFVKRFERNESPWRLFLYRVGP